MRKANDWHEKPPANVRSVADAMRRAEQKRRDLPRIVQVMAYDWDEVILADEVNRLLDILNKRRYGDKTP